MFLNLIIWKSSTKHYFLSTMANGIGQSHKIAKQKRQQPGFTNDPSNTNSSTSKIHDKFNAYIYVVSEEPLSVYS